MLEKFRFLPAHEIVSQPAGRAGGIRRGDRARYRREKSRRDLSRGRDHAETWINIDHHITNDHYGDLPYIDAAAPATGQVLYEFFRGQGLPLTCDMADNLFVAISHRYRLFPVSEHHRAHLRDCRRADQAGVNVGELSQKMYESYPRRRLELLRALLNVLRFGSGDRVASFAFRSPRRAPSVCSRRTTKA